MYGSDWVLCVHELLRWWRVGARWRGTWRWCGSGHDDSGISDPTLLAALAEAS